MNLVGNSCVSSFITRDYLKQEFVNPFVWSMVDFDSMFYCITHWDDINWFNFELKRYPKWKFSIVVEGNVKIDYVHYHFDRNATKLRVKGTDCWSNKIWEFIVDKYKTRVQRMTSKNEPPIFMFASFINVQQLTQEQLNIISNIDTKYNIVVCAQKGLTYNGPHKYFYDLTPEKRMLNGKMTRELMGSHTLDWIIPTNIR